MTPASVAPAGRPRPSVLEVGYRIAIAVKGFDGLLELLVGVLILVSPTAPHAVLTAIIGEATESTSPVNTLVTTYVRGLDRDLASSGLTVLTIFLLTHGLVKVALVFCLIKKYHRAYPVALVVLTAFLGYQLYTFVVSPTVGLALFAVLDVVIIVLVYREWRSLRRDAHSAAAA